MDDFSGILARDFGLRPQGKAAPMAPPAGSARSAAGSAFDDVFGGPPRFSQSRSSPPVDHLFPGLNDQAPKSSSMPVYDKPIYDDDIFDGIPGIRSSTTSRYDDVFSSMGPNNASAPPMEDFLENLGRPMKETKGSGSGRFGEAKEEALPGFEELIPGFGGSSPSQKRESPEINVQSSVPPSKPTINVPDDPFVVLEASTSTNSSSGLFTDPLEQISRPLRSGSTKLNTTPVSGSLFDDIDAFGGIKKSAPPVTSEKNESVKDGSPLRNAQRKGQEDPFVDLEPHPKSSSKAFDNTAPEMHQTDSYEGANHAFFEKPSKSSDSFEDIGGSGFQSSDANVRKNDRNAKGVLSSKLNEHLETADDVWLTVSEIPLHTHPTSGPPPSRPPPPLVVKPAVSGRTDRSSVNIDSKRKGDKSFDQPINENSIKNSSSSPIDELEDFVMGKPQSYAHDHAEVLYSEDYFGRNSAAAASAAAMKEAMDKAEAKFRHAKEVRERERDARSAKGREAAQQERDGDTIPDPWDLGYQEKQERLDREREQREKEEKEREEKKRQKERELELERERERARQAVERATREARERAAAEARLKAERAAVEKANAEARQRAERAAVQRAAAEARERAAAEARERAAAEARERAAAEARERAAAEARERAATEARERASVERAAAEAKLRAERAAVERAAAEARERAAAHARERAAAEAREKQQKNDHDLESFFGMGARANSAPKQRATTSDNFFDAQVQSKGFSDAPRATASTSSSTIRKASSTTNIVDDLTSIFGAAPSSGEFQEVEGESEERRRARLERHQRTRERAAKALAEKNERDLQTRREQEERHRIAETLDIDIKRWAAGKEGNLRALLSTLQYVLWPDCGWQPVSLTDLITAAAVKKVYRKATLCIHPDKVQQKGANLQQKYIAEKVFDLLKEAWNKFNSEELF